MKQNNIRFIVILGAIAIAGILTIQISWLHKAWGTSEKQLNQTIHIALQNVANKLFGYYNIQAPLENPVNQLSSSYFVVNTNSEIDPEILEHYLIAEFNLKNLNLDFEYGIYNCINDKMLYGNFIDANGDETSLGAKGNLMKHDDFVYYFGVNFPSRRKLILNSMSVWIVFSSILLLVIVFFAYAMVIILKQKRLSEQQRDFINNMTHEFKTPISSVNLSADVLLKPDIVKDTKRLNTYAGLIKQENQRLNGLVEKVLSLARIERRGFTLQKEYFDALPTLQNIVQNVVQGNSIITVQNRLNVKKHVIFADKLHFTNIVFNIIDNAVKYSGKKPIITIIIEKLGRHLKIGIEDNGKGIDRKHQKLVFKKFYRVPTGNVHDVKGFGLGLFYVKTICKLHKWKINLLSEPNIGTKIEIKIPIIENG